MTFIAVFIFSSPLTSIFVDPLFVLDQFCCYCCCYGRHGGGGGGGGGCAEEVVKMELEIKGEVDAGESGEEVA